MLRLGGDCAFSFLAFWPTAVRRLWPAPGRAAGQAGVRGLRALDWAEIEAPWPNLTAAVGAAWQYRIGRPAGQ
jgi:hypothetical protein